MNSTAFLHVYRTTASGKRVMFVLGRPPKRLAKSGVEPFRLLAMCVADRSQSEVHSYVFSEDYALDVRRDIMAFVNSPMDDTSFRKYCRESYLAFLDALKGIDLGETLPVYMSRIF